MAMRTDRERFIALNRTPGVGSAALRRLLEAFGGLDRVFAASARELQQAAGLRTPIAERLALACQDERGLERELELATRAGVTILTPANAGYPELLRTIPDPPLALYVRGVPDVMEGPAVAVVGSRRGSLYGLECAGRLSCELALRGVTVVSGLARGIDGAAHRGALKGGGRTIAVLGSGLDRLYPPEHERLAEEIARTGWLVSEHPMGTEPIGQHFPRRNRLISGLSLGVVVVEAAARSGALITADCALEQGREVFAVPGPMTSVTSQGTHHLLKQGARLVTSVEDILEELRLVPLSGGTPVAGDAEPGPMFARTRHSSLAGRTNMGGAAAGPATGTTELAEAEGRVLACVGTGPRTIDALALESGLPMPELLALLVQLELKHLVRQLPGKRFVRQ
jgi:DNA processing protein